MQARAIRRCGELAKEIEPSKGGRPGKTGAGAHPSSRKSAGTEAGMSTHQLKQAIRVANLPKEDFERVLNHLRPCRRPGARDAA